MRIHVLSFTLVVSACVHSNDCTNPQSNVELLECSQLELASQKQVLEQTTKSVSKVVPNPADLHSANKIWDNYSSTHCRSVAKIYEGGSNFDLAVTMCLIDQLKSRTKAIKQDYSDAVNIITNGSP